MIRRHAHVVLRYGASSSTVPCRVTTGLKSPCAIAVDSHRDTGYDSSSNYHCPGLPPHRQQAVLAKISFQCPVDPLSDSRRGPAAKVFSSTLCGFAARRQYLYRTILLIKALVLKPKKKLVQLIEARADINLRQGESAPFEDQPPGPRAGRS